jgi:endoglucanase
MSIKNRLILCVFPLMLVACGGSSGGSPAPSIPTISSSSSSAPASQASENSVSESSVNESSVVASSLSSSAESSAAAVEPWKTARQASEEMGAGFNLGNTFEGDQNPSSFENSKLKIDAYYAKGFRSLRIPITWTENVDGNRLADPLTGVVNRNNPRLAEIVSTIDYALTLEGLYVVINAHHEYGLKDNSGSRSAVLARIWADVTDMLGDRSPRLLFQLLNEPHASVNNGGAAMPAADLRLMSGKAYDKIRAVNPQRIIIIGGDQWFGAHELERAWPNLDAVGGGQDEYVMASFHHYSPWEFAGEDGNHGMNWTDAMLQEPFDIASAWASSVGGGMPIYVSEWGVGWQKQKPAMQCNNIRKWYQEMHYTAATAHHYPTAVWDDGGWFRVFSHATHTFDNDLADCIITGACWTGADRFANCR